MGLKAQTPTGVGHYICYHLFCVLAGAGLKEVVVGGEGQPATGILAGVNEFELVGAGDYRGCRGLPVLLWTEGDPVYAFGEGTGAVSFNVDYVAFFMETLNKSFVQL